MLIEEIDKCDERVHDSELTRIERAWTCLKAEERSLTIRVQSNALIPLHIRVPSPVGRRRARSTPRSWADAVYAEMKASDTEMVSRKRLVDLSNDENSFGNDRSSLLSPPPPPHAKRGRWTVEDVGLAFERCDIAASPSCTALVVHGACHLPPPPAVRHEARHVKRTARTRHAVLRRAWREENELRTLEAMVSSLCTSR